MLFRYKVTAAKENNCEIFTIFQLPCDQMSQFLDPRNLESLILLSEHSNTLTTDFLRAAGLTQNDVLPTRRKIKPFHKNGIQKIRFK